MFYAPAILAKKGELSQIWLAAHWQNKLTKQQTLQVNVAGSCDSIMNPQAPLALRLRGHLLVGVARIHQKKVTYLSEECSDALLKIKMAFKPGMVNLSQIDTAATPARINAPSLGHGDDETLPSPAAKSSTKNRFAGVEPKLEDDWIKLTPVQHTARRSTTRRTPAYDDQSDAKSTTTMEDKEENWVEFPFTADDASSIEVVRKHDDVNSEAASNVAPYQPSYDYDSGFIGGDDYMPPSEDAKYNAGGNAADSLNDDLMLSGINNRSWVEEAAKIREEDDNASPSANKTRRAAPSTAQGERKARKEAPGSGGKARRKRRVQTELTNEQIQSGLEDTSDITVANRLNPRDRVAQEAALRERGFPLGSSVVMRGFDKGLVQPSISGFHPAIQRLFKAHAKPVPSGAAAVEEEEDIEVVRARTMLTDTSGANLSSDASGFQYQYDDAPDFNTGDDYRPPDASDVAPTGGSEEADTLAAPDELELTFHNASEVTDTSVRLSQTSVEAEKWNPQTVKMMRLLREKLSDEPKVSYQDLAEGQKRSIVAKAFFEVLTLATRSMIHVEQKAPFGEILITPGRQYETLLPGE